MLAVVIAEGVAIALLAVLVLGLLRSHALILRALHELGAGLELEKEAGEGNAVSIEVPPLPDQPCTMDLVPHTTEFWTPQDVTTTEPLEITVLEQTIVLPTKAATPAEGGH